MSGPRDPRRQRRFAPRQGGRSGGGRSSLRVREVAPGEFELVHPPCVEERRDDYEEGLEILEAGEPDEAREVLRFALEGCGDNLWLHVALGRIALESDRDPGLAQGHFGYAYELALGALPDPFSGRLPRVRPANSPFFEAGEGLQRCLEQLGRKDESERVGVILRRLDGTHEAGQARRGH